jgi:hypothetical protein
MVNGEQANETWGIAPCLLNEALRRKCEFRDVLKICSQIHYFFGRICVC